MRVLIISDLHANWSALQAIREPFDVCLCLGDLVDYGCEPGPVIDWVRQHSLVCIRGNHDHMVAQNVVTIGHTGFKFLSGVSRPVSRMRVSDDHRRYLASLPLTKFLTLDGLRIMMVHATPRDPLDEFGPPEEEFWRRRVAGLGVDLVLVGHTHYAYELTAGDCRVVNPGSVGLPRDGDPRASYAVMENGRISFHRVAYDVEQSIAALNDAPMPPQAKEMLGQVYRTGSLPNGYHKVRAAT